MLWSRHTKITRVSNRNDGVKGRLCMCIVVLRFISCRLSWLAFSHCGRNERRDWNRLFQHIHKYRQKRRRMNEWTASYTDKWEWDKTCDVYQTSCWSMKKTIDPNDLTDDKEEKENFDSCRINRWIDRQTNCDDDEGRANELINELLCLTSKQHVRRRAHQFISTNCLESLKHD